MALTVEDLDNGKLDLITIENVTNSTDPVVVSRLGLAIKTLYAAMQELGSFTDKGAWLTATSYVIKDLVLEGGTWFTCLENHTSGVFATDYAAGKWVVYQGVTAHGPSHENGGADEISVAGLSGLLADFQKCNTANFEMVANDRVLGKLGGTVQEIAATLAGRQMLAAADAAAQRTLLSLGAAALLNVGTSAGTVAAGDDARFENFPGGLTTENMLLFEEQYATTIEPASPIGATWNKRGLNTQVINNISSASLSSGVVTLPAGDYYVEGSCLYHSGGDLILLTKPRFRNTSDSISEIVGDSGYLLGNGGSGYQFNLNLAGPVSIAGTKTFELQHYVTTATNTDFGKASDEGEREVYSRLKVWKV